MVKGEKREPRTGIQMYETQVLIPVLVSMRKAWITMYVNHLGDTYTTVFQTEIYAT